MGVFTVHDALRTAAIDAGHELGLFDALTTPLSLADLAERVRVRPTRRFAALVDALIALGALVRGAALVDAPVAVGAIVRDGALIARGDVAPHSARPMSSYATAGGGWGAIAEVIRDDTPIVIDDAEIAGRYQRHLVTAGAPAAREVATMLVALVDNRGRSPVSPQPDVAGDANRGRSPASSQPDVAGGARAIDIGGGAGAYTRAFLAADPRSHVTLVDVPEVIELARVELADVTDRVSFVAGDAREEGTNTADGRVVGFDVAIVANVLHLHSPQACAELCATAARAIGPGGVVAIVDLRRGTLEGEMFALNMALYTEGGSVYSVEQIGAWLRAAGLDAIEERRLESAPEMVVVLAHRPCKAALQP